MSDTDIAYQITVLGVLGLNEAGVAPGTEAAQIKCYPPPCQYPLCQEDRLSYLISQCHGSIKACVSTVHRRESAKRILMDLRALSRTCSAIAGADIAYAETRHDPSHHHHGNPPDPRALPSMRDANRAYGALPDPLFQVHARAGAWTTMMGLLFISENAMEELTFVCVVLLAPKSRQLPPSLHLPPGTNRSLPIMMPPLRHLLYRPLNTTVQSSSTMKGVA